MKGNEIQCDWMLVVLNSKQNRVGFCEAGHVIKFTAKAPYNNAKRHLKIGASPCSGRVVTVDAIRPKLQFKINPALLGFDAGWN